MTIITFYISHVLSLGAVAGRFERAAMASCRESRGLPQEAEDGDGEEYSNDEDEPLPSVSERLGEIMKHGSIDRSMRERIKKTTHAAIRLLS